ncbi:hypothetical protein POV27_08195 [Aureisphaera galaxeae]|uniref:hypothetical protein n=1 Tax=Aureisphaera galaxeae TaxID=1538023 RepID=UPI002350E0FC|nr:hypothetical protein [Aureisphaera galaxeae]MDC8004030.1 hypothetical protein [Aureisphaera galaxeae]
MPLLKRFVYYFGGLVLGLCFLYFFIGGSGASCEMDYLPNARVLKNIRLKERVFSDKVLQELASKQLDTSAISTLLEDGDVLFSESNTDGDPCNVYVIRGKASEQWLKITVENCENQAKVNDIFISNSK